MLAYFKNKLGTVDIAIEVGVWRGKFSLEMIRALSPAQFYGVDPYRIFPGMVSAPSAEYREQSKLDILAETSKNKLESHGGKLIREVSAQAASQFEDNSIDIVYLDGDHTYKGVITDIDAWLPKIKIGGFLCGHDYCEGKTGLGFDYGVIEAVNEKFENFSVTKDRPASWFVEK